MRTTQDFVIPDSGLLPLSRLPWQKEVDGHFDEKQPWVANLLSELSEDVGDEIAMIGEENITLTMDFSLEKKRHPHYGEILLVKGQLHASFPTLCSRTGAVIVDKLSAEVNACFLHENLKKTAEDPLEEEIDVVIGEEVFDLYFYAPRGASLSEMAHEYIYLNKNPYPQVNLNSDDSVDS